MIARDDVTCLVLAPERPSTSAGRGARRRRRTGGVAAGRTARRTPTSSDCFTVDVTPTLDRKVAALAAHRSQYAMEADLLPRSMLERLLGTEHFVVADIPGR